MRKSRVKVTIIIGILLIMAALSFDWIVRIPFTVSDSDEINRRVAMYECFIALKSNAILSINQEFNNKIYTLYDERYNRNKVPQMYTEANRIALVTCNKLKSLRIEILGREIPDCYYKVKYSRFVIETTGYRHYHFSGDDLSCDECLICRNNFRRIKAKILSIIDDEIGEIERYLEDGPIFKGKFDPDYLLIHLPITCEDTKKVMGEDYCWFNSRIISQHSRSLKELIR